ncbi:CopG family transcriptional regulator [Pseudanabaena biceps]|nr:CopG family transcriptional regulator [Pseudanabaena biceps]
MSQINTQIDPATTDKLTYIQQQTNQTLADVLCYAIDSYYQKLKQEHKKTPFEILEESGFIGCCSIESDLSTNYKQVLAIELEAKYDHR